MTEKPDNDISTGRDTGPGIDRPPRRGPGWWKRTVFWLVVLGGIVTVVLVLLGTDDDPIGVIISAWPVVVVAAFLYLVGMACYALSWAHLFETKRRSLALGFLISQPIKYLPGGVAQPIAQIALGVETTGSPARILIAFPVHVLINVVAGATLGAPLLLIAPIPSWSRWAIVLVPLLWVILDRRWMGSVLTWLARFRPRLREAEAPPSQALINRAFLWALAAHGLMFTSFGVLTGSAIPGWTSWRLILAFAVAWLVGYVVIPAPAGIGAREAALVAILGGALTTAEVVGITVVHRVMTMIIELVMLVAAVWLARRHHDGTSRAPIDDPS